MKSVIILGSTGSIGASTLAAINKSNNFNIRLLSTNKNSKKILKQAIKYKVKNIIIENKNEYLKYKKLFKKKKINLYLGLSNLTKIIRKKLDYCVNAISGIDGLEPTLDIIPLTKNLLIANKETIICGWELILKNITINKTNFIPLDSEHFSIWKLIKNEKKNNINKVILTASGGPFLNKSLNKISNINPRKALNHPNWKMGKKISIDSSTMMNKIFEYIEAKKIFNLEKKKLSILIHPLSFVHAIIFFNGGLIKMLAHDTDMIIPISNALNIIKKNKNNFTSNQLKNLNNLNFQKASNKIFPLLKLVDLIPEKQSYFETILITINDELVKKYLAKKINFISIHLNLLNLIKKPYFKKYYKLKPKNIYDIKKMIDKTKMYLELNFKHYEK